MITLREYTSEDGNQFKEWLAMPHVARWYHEPELWVEEVEDPEGKFTWIRHFIVECEGKAIGFCQYYEYVLGEETWHGSVPVEGTYSLDYLIGDPAYLRKGYGKEIAKALVEEIRKEKNAVRIIVQPEPENTASCRTLLGSGFTYDAKNELYILGDD